MLQNNFYSGLEKEYLEGLISPSLWCDSRTRNQFLFREIRARCMDLTVNQWLDEFDPHTRSQSKSRSSRGLGHHPFTVSTPVRIRYRAPIYRGLEKEYLEGLISPSLWCDSRTRNQTTEGYLGWAQHCLENRWTAKAVRVRFCYPSSKIRP